MPHPHYRNSSLLFQLYNSPKNAPIIIKLCQPNWDKPTHSGQSFRSSLGLCTRCDETCAEICLEGELTCCYKTNQGHADSNDVGIVNVGDNVQFIYNVGKK